jgi:glycosyltransferase involved in cell wall biosynthesis
VTLSVVIITNNEEVNIGRTLANVKPLVADGMGEIIVVDSGSTDRTVEIAKLLGAKVFSETWKGYAAQKNSAIEKATGDWILSLDGDESLDEEAASEVRGVVSTPPKHVQGYYIRRKNHFLGRWIRYGGFWPDPKLRLFLKSAGRFEDRAVHEDVKIDARATGQLGGALLHYSYPTVSDYIHHMNEYSSLGAEMAVAKGYRGWAGVDIVLRPAMTFVYNYFFRLGFLDGREGLLLHLNHAVYVAWKYAKAWELRQKASPSR